MVADYVAMYSGKLFITLSLASPTTLLATAGCFQATRKAYGFPFYTPKPPKFNPDKFPGLPLGSNSRFMWHSLRALSWYAFSKVGVSLLISSYGISVYAASLRADPTLEPYRQDVQRRVKAGRESGVGKLLGVFGASEDHQQPPSTSEYNPASASDSAPTAWAGSENPRQGPTSSWTGARSSQPKPSQEAPFEEPSVFDDASPVAPSEQQKAASQQRTQQGGSAWDRLRNQARPARNQTTSWEKRREDEMTSRGAQDGTSYNYSSADEEKVYAKEQAQKEFDDMLEGERQGQSGYPSRR